MLRHRDCLCLKNSPFPRPKSQRPGNVFMSLNAWWRTQSPSNLSPRLNSLLTGKLTGNFRYHVVKRRNLASGVCSTIPDFQPNSLHNRTGNYFGGTGNSGTGTRNYFGKNRINCPTRPSVRSRMSIDSTSVNRILIGDEDEAKRRFTKRDQIAVVIADDGSVALQ